MNQLKKKAWKELGIYVCSLISGCVGLLTLIHHANEVSILNNFAIRFFLISIIIVIGIWATVGRFILKRRKLKKLDERERLIYEKAEIVSDSIFGGLCLAGFLGIFAWLGPKAPIPVFVPVLMFMGFAFIAEMIKPLIVLIQCQMERPDE